MEVGQSFEEKKVYTDEMVRAFSEVSGDKNPIHLDEDYSKDTIFGKRIVHGLFVSSNISSVIANHLPGPGSIYLSQDLKFKLPVYIDDEITTRVEIINIREDKPIVGIRTTCINQDGKTVIEGEAYVRV
jgi:acyl dehydratase